MPSVLIAGCGYVGNATAQLCAAAGWEVEGWTSSPDSAAALGPQAFKIRAVDLTDRAAVQSAGGDFDAVVQCASSRGGGVEGYERIYRASARHLRERFPNALHLFTSSTSVYAQTNGEWVTEESAAEPKRATARVLRETEDFVLEHGGIVARLAGIYGPGRSALLTKFLAGTASLDPGADRFLNHVHRDDVATALLHLLKAGTRERADSGQIFNVSDGHPISRRECFEWLAERLGRPMPVASAAVEQRKRGDGNKRVSSAKLQVHGWQPRYGTFQIAMNDSILPSFLAGEAGQAR